MNLQVLISTMHQENFDLLKKMNVSSDAIVINQCDKNDFNEFEFNKRVVKWYSFNERGVGLSRNSALMRSTADIILFADDDIIYDDNYEEKILNEFKNNPHADMIIFNLESQNEERPEFINTKKHFLSWYNCLKYGAAKIAVKREALLKSNICFSLLFGGGAKYSFGEDSLFITNCLQNKMKILASDVTIGKVLQEESTWFTGYNEKFYHDRGCLFKAMYKSEIKAKLIITLFELKNIRRKSDFSFLEILKMEFQGIRDFKNE